MCRHEARGGGHWVLTAGLVRYFYGVTPPARWLRLNLIERSEVLAQSLPRGLKEGREADGVTTITNEGHDSALERLHAKLLEQHRLDSQEVEHQ
jgi:hypothetical protein